MTDLILQEQKHHILYLNLNRPGKLNALNYALIDQLYQSLQFAEMSPDIRAVILSGGQCRAFSAGGDIPEFTHSIRQSVDQAGRDFVQRGQRLTRYIENFPKPLIVAVNGLAFGGGCEITEAAPLAIASDQALFAKPEIAIGIPPTFGGTQRLSRLAGRKKAMALLLTGDHFSPAQALDYGVITDIVAHDTLIEAATNLAQRIICHSPLAIARIMTAVTQGGQVAIEQGLRIEAEQFARMAVTADVMEGLEAWAERRQPVYQGR